MGIPLVRGARLRSRPTSPARPVVLVNETLVKTFFKDRSHRSGSAAEASASVTRMPWFTIVGVVRDVKQGGMAAKTGTELYFLHEQGRAPCESAPAQHEHRGSDDAAARIARARTSAEIVRTMDPRCRS